MMEETELLCLGGGVKMFNCEEVKWQESWTEMKTYTFFPFI